MFCHVYRLRHNGARQVVDEVLRLPPRYGWLAYNRPHVYGMPGEHAHLFAEERGTFELLPELRHAKVKRIEGGLLLAGTEELFGSSAKQVIQTWAVGVTVDQAATLVRALRRKQDVIAALWAERQG